MREGEGVEEMFDHWCSKAKLIRVHQIKATSTVEWEREVITRLRSTYDCFFSFHMRLKTTANISEHDNTSESSLAR